jgi:hypothetical protein
MLRLGLGILLPFAAAGGILTLTTGDPSPGVMLIATAVASIAMIAVTREALR